MAQQTDLKIMTYLGVFSVVVCALFVNLVNATSETTPKCHCIDPENCQPRKKYITTEPQVFVFSGQMTNIHLWRWSTINTVIVPSNFSLDTYPQAETLCITRRQQKNFAITVDFDVGIKTSGVLSQEELDTWRNDVVKKQSAWRADYVNIDFLPYFRADVASSDADHDLVTKTLHALKDDLNKTEFLCVVPWMPPCAEDGKCAFTGMMKDTCDYFIINPDSFLDTKGVKCVAQANIPFSKMLYGITEYNAHLIPSSQLILGVSWHGYDYTCSDQMPSGRFCHLDTHTVNGSGDTSVQVCDYSQRVKVSHGDILSSHALAYNERKRAVIFNAPYFNYKNGTVSHQVWFEDQKSLQSKYRLVNELKFKGIAIMYGSDLTPSSSPNLLANEELMWSWLAHEYIHTIAKTPTTQSLHCADTVAGVAVGCLVLGVALGVIFTCIGMQRRVKKPHYSRKDTDPLGDEFMDDPDL